MAADLDSETAQQAGLSSCWERSQEELELVGHCEVILTSAPFLLPVFIKNRGRHLCVCLCWCVPACLPVCVCVCEGDGGEQGDNFLVATSVSQRCLCVCEATRPCGGVEQTDSSHSCSSDPGRIVENRIQ